ncbi:hypothetical protein PG994_014611 [Apiospora phragmitis]|uniref:Hemoglobin n=1 Tax=Apiospora phragmitis TaxID=2905665 RepID=A0ABR1T4T7_9PEZI
MGLLTPRDKLTMDNEAIIFIYNETFGDNSNESEQAWKELMPLHGGFFRHPTLAPEKSVFSVFHQLRCLQRVLKDEEMPKMSAPRHFRHCVDLLRQVLMCQPDLTVEVKNITIGGVKGFGTEHQCKDWNQLIAFTEEWGT